MCKKTNIQSHKITTVPKHSPSVNYLDLNLIEITVSADFHINTLTQDMKTTYNYIHLEAGRPTSSFSTTNGMSKIKIIILILDQPPKNNPTGMIITLTVVIPGEYSPFVL